MLLHIKNVLKNIYGIVYKIWVRIQNSIQSTFLCVELHTDDMPVYGAVYKIYIGTHRCISNTLLCTDQCKEYVSVWGTECENLLTGLRWWPAPGMLRSPPLIANESGHGCDPIQMGRCDAVLRRAITTAKPDLIRMMPYSAPAGEHKHLKNGFEKEDL